MVGQRYYQINDNMISIGLTKSLIKQKQKY